MRLASVLPVLTVLAITAVESAAQQAGTIRSQTVPGTDVVFDVAYVPAGTFSLGSPSDEGGRDVDEGPQREVSLSAFWMSTAEVTYDLFALFRFRRLDDDVSAVADEPFDADAVTRPSPPYEDPSHGMGGAGYPATGMTRLSALHFARWLSEKTGTLYRLPTEAEWEYACKVGAGDPGTAWYEDTSGGAYHPVASSEPNGLGVHELHGNVAEWVMDSYAADAYAGLAEGEEDPLHGTPARGRGIVRGGSFDDPLERLRCAERYPEASAWKARDPQMPKSRWWNTDSPHVGFRLVSPAREHTLAEIRAYWAEILGA